MLFGRRKTFWGIYIFSSRKQKNWFGLERQLNWDGGSNINWYMTFSIKVEYKDLNDPNNSFLSILVNNIKI